MRAHFTIELFIRLNIVWQRKTYEIPFECNSGTRPTVGRSLEIKCAVGSNELSQNINKREPKHRKSDEAERERMKNHNKIDETDDDDDHI